MLCKIFKLFVNIFNGDDKYSVLNRESLTQPIQILLSQKQQTFSPFLSVFLKSTLNFEHFEKKELTLIANILPKLQTPKKVIR